MRVGSVPLFRQWATRLRQQKKMKQQGSPDGDTVEISKEARRLYEKMKKGGR